MPNYTHAKTLGQVADFNAAKNLGSSAPIRLPYYHTESPLKNWASTGTITLEPTSPGLAKSSLFTLDGIRAFRAF